MKITKWNLEEEGVIHSRGGVGGVVEKVTGWESEERVKNWGREEGGGRQSEAFRGEGASIKTFLPPGKRSAHRARNMSKCCTSFLFASSVYLPQSGPLSLFVSNMPSVPLWPAVGYFAFSLFYPPPCPCSVFCWGVWVLEMFLLLWLVMSCVAVAHQKIMFLTRSASSPANLPLPHLSLCHSFFPILPHFFFLFSTSLCNSLRGSRTLPPN